MEFISYITQMLGSPIVILPNAWIYRLSDNENYYSTLKKFVNKRKKDFDVILKEKLELQDINLKANKKSKKDFLKALNRMICYDREEEIKDFSLITYYLSRLFNYFNEKCSLSSYIVGTREDFHVEFEKGADKVKKAKDRGTKIEKYILVWLLIFCPLAFVLSEYGFEIAELSSECFALYITIFFISNILPLCLCYYRIFEILITAINLNIFTPLRVGSKNHHVSSITRTLILLVINFIEIALLFAIIYNLQLWENYKEKSIVDTLIFSFSKQFSIDVSLDKYEIFNKTIVFQGVISYFFSLLVLSRFISLISGPKTVQKE